MVILPPSIDQLLYKVAPTVLENRRPTRYRGDDVSVSIASFSMGDQVRIRHIYRVLWKLRENLEHREPPEGISYITAFLEDHRHSELAESAQSFGLESFAARPSEGLAKAIHDLRGGGLTPLIGLLDVADLRGVDGELAAMLFYIARDHLKIMRNVLLGLDDPQRERDLRPAAHGTDLIVEKWHNSVIHEDGRHIQLVVDCREASTIGACCMEFAALDRILYNLINNACRHTAGDVVKLTIFPVPDDGGANLRFVLVNGLSPADADRLRTWDLATLFRERVSTTGSGLGLAIVNEFVSRAYGLPSPGDAVRRRYVGATLFGDSFAAWFHWPKVSSR